MKEIALLLLIILTLNGETVEEDGGAARDGRQLAGLGWRLIQASRNAEERDKTLGQRNVEVIKKARRDFWDRINLAMEREELQQEDNRSSLATRFHGVRRALNTAMARDEGRRRENKEALHHMMETMLPTGRIIGFWRNLGQSLNKRI